MTCEFDRYDGAYVLGSLSPAERREFERHLTTCKECALAVQELAGVPGLLSRLDLETVENPAIAEPAPATLLPSLVQDVRRSQRRRMAVMLSGAVAAAAAVTVTSLAVTGLLGGDPGVGVAQGPTTSTSVAQGREMTQVGQSDLRATVAFADVAWGTRLDVTCTYRLVSYAQGTPPSYALVVRTRDGGVQQVATWRAVRGGTMTVTAATASRRSDIVSVEVQTLAGDAVLKLTT